MTDTSTANWEYADTTQSGLKDGRTKEMTMDAKKGMLDGRMSTPRAPELHNRGIYKRVERKMEDELTRGKQRTGQHQLLSDFQLLFQ